MVAKPTHSLLFCLIDLNTGSSAPLLFHILLKEPGIDHTYPLSSFPTLPLHAPPIASFDHRTQVSLETGYFNSSPCHLCLHASPFVSAPVSPVSKLRSSIKAAHILTSHFLQQSPSLSSSLDGISLPPRVSNTAPIFLKPKQHAQPANHVRSRGPPTSPDLHLR
jgi:hypothetical protein